MHQSTIERFERYTEQLNGLRAFEELYAEEQYRVEVLLESCQERGDAASVRFLREQLLIMRLDQENLVRTSLDALHAAFLGRH